MQAALELVLMLMQMLMLVLMLKLMLDKAIMQVEKEELQTALEEAESALEQEENKVVRAGLELQQVRTFFQRNKSLHKCKQEKKCFFSLVQIKGTFVPGKAGN